MEIEYNNTDKRDINHNTNNASIRKYGVKKYEYSPPTKTVSQYESEIKGLEREIEIAKEKIQKLLTTT